MKLCLFTHLGEMDEAAHNTGGRADGNRKQRGSRRSPSERWAEKGAQLRRKFDTAIDEREFERELSIRICQ